MSKYTKRVKREAFERYGTYCVNCGESRPELLTLDHIDNNGASHRKALKVSGGIPFYIKLRALGWPEGLQTLCFNCNCSKPWKLLPRPRLLHLTRRLAK